MGINQDVVWLHVSIDNILAVHVLQSKNDAPNIETCQLLAHALKGFASPELTDMRQKLWGDLCPPIILTAFGDLERNL
jgi:hypothetical protein